MSGRWRRGAACALAGTIALMACAALRRAGDRLCMHHAASHMQPRRRVWCVLVCAFVCTRAVPGARAPRAQRPECMSCGARRVQGGAGTGGAGAAVHTSAGPPAHPAGARRGEATGARALPANARVSTRACACEHCPNPRPERGVRRCPVCRLSGTCTHTHARTHARTHTHTHTHTHILSVVCRGTHSLCLSVYLSICLSVYLYLSICVSVYMLS